MFNIVQKRRWYFLFSACFIIPGLMIMLYSTITTGAPFRLGIDFVGGSIYELEFRTPITEDQLRDVFADYAGDENVVVQAIGAATESHWVVTVIDYNEAAEAVFAELPEVVVENNGRLLITRGEDGEPDIYELTFPAGETMIAQVLPLFEGLDAVMAEEILDRSRWSVRGMDYDDETRAAVRAALDELGLNPASFRFELVSGTIGAEVTQAAILAVAAAMVVVTGFIVVAFRQVPNAFRYGICAITAMVHDVFIVMAVMSLAGLLLGWEVDALFLTAVLTVVGFSVQDSIVVFDRIRENIPRRLGEPYETIVNRSIWETIHRSLATQLNAFFIMIAILLFGGDTIKQFISIFFVGLLTGTYSSIFIAVPMLVAWQKGEIPLLKGDEEMLAAAKQKR